MGNSKILDFTKKIMESATDDNTKNRLKQHLKGSGNTKISKPPSSGKISQKIEGDNNFQFNGDINHYSKPPVKKIVPSEGMIGANSYLKQMINERFNKLGEEREKRFGQSAYPVMYKNFKKDFGIKEQKWTVIWELQEYCAQEIINYLDKKYDNTIQGRIKSASTKKDYIHKRPHLFAMEEKYLSQMGLDKKDPEVINWLQEMFNVTSHTKLNDFQLWQLVKLIENKVIKLED